MTLASNRPSEHWYSTTIVLGNIFLPASPSTRQIPSHASSTISSLTSPEALAIVIGTEAPDCCGKTEAA